VGLPVGLVGDRVGALLGAFFVGAFVVQAPQETSTLQHNILAHQQRPEHPSKSIRQQQTPQLHAIVLMLQQPVDAMDSCARGPAILFEQVHAIGKWHLQMV
jgi:hypothetical protein